MQRLSLEGGGYVGMTESGSIEVMVGGERYRIESSFSYPSPGGLRHNRFGADRRENEESWNPIVGASEGKLEAKAQGRFFSVRRELLLRDGRVKLKDTVTNLWSEPVGVIHQSVLEAEDGFTTVLLGGSREAALTMTAENPSLFVSGNKSSLGIIAEDSLLRLQLEASVIGTGGQLGVKHFGLDARQSHTFEWGLYPFSGRSDYFDFVNAVRSAWSPKATVEGPFDFMDTRHPLLDDEEKLKRYLERKNLRVVALPPWLFYYDGAGLDPNGYSKLMERAIGALKKASPGIRCLGCIEHNIVSFDRQKLPRSVNFDDVCRASGKYPIVLSPEQTRTLEKSIPWGDCLVKTAEGRAMVEDCAPASFIHPIVYSREGNYHAQYLMDQIKFLLERVGTDGVYVDQFNMAFDTMQRYHYGSWDGHTVDIDEASGEITRKYWDAGIGSIPVRKALCEYVLSRGKMMVVNTHAAAREMQPLPILRFMEAGWVSKKVVLEPGTEPPLLPYLCKGHFDSPIGLGVAAQQMEAGDGERMAEIITRAAIIYLRHGLLYYHYLSEIPSEGPGSGAYGPINRMFPLTPVELHKGWIRGKERSVTAVSLESAWSGSDAPRVTIYDERGRETASKGRFTIVRAAGGWRFSLKLKDWQEIAIIE